MEHVFVSTGQLERLPERDLVKLYNELGGRVPHESVAGLVRMILERLHADPALAAGPGGDLGREGLSIIPAGRDRGHVQLSYFQTLSPRLPVKESLVVLLWVLLAHADGLTIEEAALLVGRPPVEARESLRSLGEMGWGVYEGQNGRVRILR